MKTRLKGNVKAGTKTKQLLSGLEPYQILVIRHDDLDEVAAEGIVDAKVLVVVNAGQTMSGKYPSKGAAICLDNGIPIVEIDEEDYTLFRTDIEAEVDTVSGEIRHAGHHISGRTFTIEDWRSCYERAHRRLPVQWISFINNTLAYARTEKYVFARPLHLADVQTRITGRHVIIVARGSGYRQDLKAIRQYIVDYRPVLIGVDGGADALVELGWKPDLIVGDMDSVTAETLASGAEIIVHAYPDGSAPGLRRVQSLGLAAHTVAIPGTSEDLAMLLAYEKKAEWIVTIGAHTHMIDFLEKGRDGMASTMLVRMKIGAKLIDAKGVRMLYRPRPQLKWIWPLMLAGTFPVAVVTWLHPGLQHQLRMLLTYLKLLAG